MSVNLFNKFTRSLGQLAAGIAFLLVLQPQALADQITLNLKEADIRALISTVSKFTGKNFVVDPRVKAKVTVVSANTMSEEEVYEVFLSVLQVHGYAAVPVGSIIKIVPEVNAKQGPLPLDNRNRHKGDTFITRVITLDHVPAAQLVPILRPLVPQQGHLAAYNPTNTLIITDYASNIKRLGEIIESIDKPESDELEIIPLKHASASELVRILNSLHATGGGAPANTPQNKKVVLAADDRTNSILMSGERAERLKIRATIAHLDTPLQDGDGNTHVIYLKYAKAADLVKILTGVQKGQETTKNPKAPAQIAAKTNADIQSDESTNAIIITAGPDVVRRMKSIIRQLDIRRAQVLVESIIAEISNDKAKDRSAQFVLGGKEGAENTVPAGVSNFGGGNGIVGLFGADPLSVLGDGLTFGAGRDTGNRFAFLLKALNADAATNILSTPSIVTLDNQEAEIVVGQNVPFLTGSFTNTGGGDGATNPFQTIERQDVGITLKVTPQINDGDTIKLDIDQEISSLAESTVSGPITKKRTIKTSVLVEDGEVLVLGGLIDDNMRDRVQKVPILGDVPLLGALFRSHSTSKSKQNLMIFMRPSILRDKASALYHTNDKYNYLRAQQIQASEKGFGLLRDEAAPLLPPLNELSSPENKPESQLQSPEKNIPNNSLKDEYDFL
ncbi:MAG: type II secretion system secretin GspD [Gammaproteobacteria bacterium]|nr:type II secretion system secretin GspD [Gammaproteobacteria bacterium]